jgi:hypothetical protein
MAKTTYFTDVTMISVHTISDNTPSTTSGVGVPTGRRTLYLWKTL